MSSEDLLYREENGVAWITINRPDSGNSMTPEIRDRMCEIVRGFNGQFSVRAAVITAAGEKGEKRSGAAVLVQHGKGGPILGAAVAYVD